MTGLDFLDQGLGRAEDGFEPVRRSPLESALRDAPAGVRDISLDPGMTSEFAGIEVTGERLLRRLTDLDLDALPATGMVAHVRATVRRHGDEFQIVFPQEYADHVAGVVIDAIAGLA